MSWDRAKRLFHAAAALEVAERDTFVREACGGDAALAAEVRSLLDWNDGATGFLESPVVRVADLADFADGPGVADGARVADEAEPAAIPAPAHEPLIGTSLGPWRIVALLGRGGMGEVYRAERADEAFSRQAAVKVMGRGGDPAQIAERFRRERETLAALDHPNIARVFDGGTTPAGRPYFVMELVDGVPVDAYCDARRLDVDARLRLFLAVCAGVQYAHQNLVVHRDIKPDNILVSRDGTPKLLDFGVAKLLGPAASSALEQDAFAATWLMTPDYASPEQVFGRPVTTATDVYSLGVLLHVLLTGTRPYHLTGASRADLQQQLATAGTTRISSVAAAAGQSAQDHAAHRGTTPGQLARRLSGDLDAILQRAISKDPAGRYATVEQLMEDVDRHLTSRPVSARAGTPAYVAGRFLRRHVAGALVAAGVLLLLAVGVGLVAWQARIAAEARSRAERRFEDVRRLARTFMFDVHDAIVNVPGTTAARALMVRTAVQYLDGLAAEATGDRGLQRELAEAYVKVGDAQGHPTSANVGDTEGARASYERAVTIADRLLRAAPDDIDVQRTLAMAHRRLADVAAWSGGLDEALGHMRRSAAIFTTIAARDAPDTADRLQAGIAQIKLGDLFGNPNFPNLARPAEASRHYAAALSALRQLAAGAPGDVPVRRYLGLTLERVGTMHEQERQWAEAAQAYGESFEIRKALAEAEPYHTDIQRDLAIAFEKVGNARRFSDGPAASLESYRGALAQFERLARADPSNVVAARSVAIGREKLADVLAQTGGGEEAVRLLTPALAAHRDLVARDAANTQARCDVARVSEGLGDLVSARAGTPGAEAPSTSACERWRESLEARRAIATSGANACSGPSDVERVQAKLRRCR